MIKVLSIPLYDGSLSNAVGEVLHLCESNEMGNSKICVSATGSHGLVCSKLDHNFAAVLASFFRNLPDGVPLVWVGRLKGAKQMQRCYGPDFFEQTMRRSAGNGIKHFLCGGKNGVAEELRQVCREKFGNNNCIGTFTPPFRDMNNNEMRSLADMISNAKADIVWIGMSTPKQEIFAKKLSQFTKAKLLITVGAAFDFHTGRVRQAPSWMQKSGLEWLFRLLVEPKRLWKRYAVVVPLFIYYNVLEILTGKFFNNQSKENADGR